MNSPMNSRHGRKSIRFEPQLLRALRDKALVSRRSISALVNEAVRAALAEDADDIAEAELRRQEPTLPFDEAVADLQRRGLL